MKGETNGNHKRKGRPLRPGDPCEKIQQPASIRIPHRKYNTPAPACQEESPESCHAGRCRPSAGRHLCGNLHHPGRQQAGDQHPAADHNRRHIHPGHPRPGRKTKDGKKITNFIECVAWRAQAEFVCKYLSKGHLVLVEGELTSRSYEDKDGNRRKAVEITVDSVHFCDSKKDGRQSSGSDFADPGYSEGSGDFAEIEDNGDLPF